MNDQNDILVTPTVTTETTSRVIPLSEQIPTPAIGKRVALLDIGRKLTDQELSQTGAQKLLIEMLTEAETENEELKVYQEKFYDADKRAAILSEKLRANRSIEIFFGVGVGLGGTILGFSTFFFTLGISYGLITLVVGLGLIIGSCIGRAVKI